MAIITVTTASDSGAGSLRDAIARAQSGDTIQFSSTLANQTITLTSGELVIPNDKDLIIDGSAASGLTISGNQQSRIFNVESTFISQTQFTVKNLVLSSAATSDRGGAVFATDQAQLRFEGVTFRNNSANGGGASVFSNRGSVFVTDSRFENNQATGTNDERGSAGITAVEASEVTVLNSVFTGNKGINGAAINTLNSKLTVRNSQFLNNDVLAATFATNDPNGNNFLRGYGGAIYTDRASDTTIIENSVFEGNSSRAAGGAVYLFNDPEDVVTITDTSFRNNKAIGLPGGEGGNGGAVEHQRNTLGSGSLTLTDVSFIGNEANGQGGALRERNANTTITNATIAQNRVFGSDFSNNGGGIIFSGNGTANVVNSTLAFNRAGWVGGGISAENGVQVNLRNSIFYENTADNGGNGWGILQHSNRLFTDQGGNFQWQPGINNDSNVTSSITLADVRLGTLQQVGNLWAYPLLDGSPAINAAVAGAPSTDIRGANRVGNADSGSFEFGGIAPTPNPNPNPTPDPNPTPNPTPTPDPTPNPNPTPNPDPTPNPNPNPDPTPNPNPNPNPNPTPNPEPTPISISVRDLAIAEGNGASNAVVTVSLSGVSNQPVSVNYATADGTAIAEADYTALSGSLTFAPGELSQTLSIPILGDTVVEPSESFTLNLSQPTNAAILDGQSLITLQNDDVAPPANSPSVSINDVTRFEGSSNSRGFAFAITLSNPFTEAVSVNYATADGSAIAGSDYIARAGSVTFNPGETSKRIRIRVIPDGTAEATETFTVQLSDPTNASLQRASGVGTIVNDDLPSLSQVQEVVAGGLSTAGNLLENPFAARPEAIANPINAGLDSLTANAISLKNLFG